MLGVECSGGWIDSRWRERKIRDMKEYINSSPSSYLGPWMALHNYDYLLII